MSAVDILLLLKACTHFANVRHGTAQHNTARHGRARPLSAYCSCASAANFFLEKLLFSHTKVVPIYGFLFLNTIILQLRVTRLQFCNFAMRFVQRKSFSELRRGHKHSLQFGPSWHKIPWKISFEPPPCDMFYNTKPPGKYVSVLPSSA